jgi:hypothetical protein
MFKNVASQSIALFAFDSTTGAPKTGDSANMLFYVTKDWGTVTAIAAASGVPTEMDATKAQAETNADALLFSGKSSTANVVVAGQLISTDPASYSTLVIDGSGRVDVSKVSGTSQTARDLGASVLLSPGTGTGQISLTAGAVTAGTVSDKTGYALTAGERNSIADAALDRDMSTGADSGTTTIRTVRQALRALRNKVAIAAGTVTVYKEDDTTSSWTGAVTTDAAANPITAIDPAG